MSAMAGYVGGGGLGNFAITYGYQQFNWPVTLVTVVIIIVIVQAGAAARQQAGAHRPAQVIGGSSITSVLSVVAATFLLWPRPPSTLPPGRPPAMW